jgi:hypothetical protein
MSIEDNAVGIVLQAVNDSGAQEFVWEGVIPFG